MFYKQTRLLSSQIRRQYNLETYSAEDVSQL
jgi:hypothetical protein